MLTLPASGLWVLWFTLQPITMGTGEPWPTDLVPTQADGYFNAPIFWTDEADCVAHAKRYGFNGEQPLQITRQGKSYALFGTCKQQP